MPEVTLVQYWISTTESGINSHLTTVNCKGEANRNDANYFSEDQEESRI